MTVLLRTAAAIVLSSLVACGALAATGSDSAVDSSGSDQAGSLASDIPPSPPPVQDGQILAASDAVPIADQAKQGGCDEGLQCPCCSSPVWDVSAGAVILHRQRPEVGTIVAANPGLTPAFSSGNDFDFDWTAGPDVTIDRRMASGNIWDARFFNNYESDTNEFVTPGAFIGAGFTGPANTNFLAHYATKLNSFELNWEHPLTDQFLFLAGFRAIDLDDDLVYHIDNTVATGDYGYRNRLYGAQLGGDWALTSRGNPLQISVVGKAGVYSNSSDGGITESSGGIPIGSFTGTGLTSAFVGELDISAAYIISPHWAIRGGYQLLWLDDLALASDAASRSLTNPAS